MHIGNNTEHLLVYFQPTLTWFNDDGTICSILCEPICKLQTRTDIYDTYGNLTKVPVPGFYTSSYFIESLLFSQLQCLYNQSCVDAIVNLFHRETNFTVLSKTRHFSNNLFIAS